MRWNTRQQDQGQIAEISYAYDMEGGAYRRTHDRSDGTTSYAYGDLDMDREPEHKDRDHAPCVESWTPCAAPDA